MLVGRAGSTLCKVWRLLPQEVALSRWRVKSQTLTSSISVSTALHSSCSGYTRSVEAPDIDQEVLEVALFCWCTLLAHLQLPASELRRASGSSTRPWRRSPDLGCNAADSVASYCLPDLPGGFQI